VLCGGQIEGEREVRLEKEREIGEGKLKGRIDGERERDVSKGRVLREMRETE